MAQEPSPLGTVPQSNGLMDATHLAHLSVEAGESLYPGEFVKIDIIDNKYIAFSDEGGCAVVDPFRRQKIKKGQLLFVVMEPNTISSLCHTWTHPQIQLIKNDFQKLTEFNEHNDSKKWLENYADTLGVDYEELICATKRYLNYGDYWNQGSRFESEYIPDEFWEHYEKVMNVKIAPNAKYSFLTCSC